MMKRRTKRHQLYAIAYEVRRAVVGGGDPLGLCYDCSWELARRLAMRGVPVEVVKGGFRSDVKQVYLDGSIGFVMSAHFWVQSGAYIIDVTADQFNTELDKPMPKVLVSRAWRGRYQVKERLAT